MGSNPNKLMDSELTYRKTLAPPRPVSRAAAMVSDSDDSNDITLQMVNQGVGKTMKGKRPRLVRTAFTHRGKLPQQPERPFDLVDEVIRCEERTFADISVNGGIGVGLRFVAKTDLRHFLQQGLLCEAGS